MWLLLATFCMFVELLIKALLILAYGPTGCLYVKRRDKSDGP